MKNSYLLLSAICCAGCASETAEKPNVIVILADDLGFGDVSAYGSATIHTPHIDKLANEGVCFTNGYATSLSLACTRGKTNTPKICPETLL